MADATIPSTPRGAPFLGWRSQRRPRPGFAHVLGAAAGAFAVVAMVAFVAAIDDQDPQTAGTALSLVLVLVALAAGFRGPGPLRSAGATALVLTVPLVWVFALIADGDAGRSEVRGILLLTLLCYAALYLLTWTKGRAVFLAGALILLTVWVAFEVAGDSGSAVPFGNSISGSSSSSGSSNGIDLVPGNTTVDTGGDNSDSVNGAIMALGVVFLVTGGLLDQRKLAGTATPFIVVGALAAVFGGIGLAASESTLAAGIVAVLVGSAVGIVAAAGRERRATTWLGVIVVFGGFVAILVDIAPDSAEGVGAIALAFAVALGVIAWWLAPVLREPDDGDDITPAPPTAPEGGDVAGDPGDTLSSAAA